MDMTIIINGGDQIHLTEVISYEIREDFIGFTLANQELVFIAKASILAMTNSHNMKYVEIIENI